MNMANKFLIEKLSSISTPLLSADYAIVEQQSATYKIDMQSLYKDVLSNRLEFKVGRNRRKGSPNVLSLMFNDDDGSQTYLKSVTLQDGMLSAVNFDPISNYLSLYFNTPTFDLSDTVVVDLNSLEDRYFAGYGLELSDYGEGRLSG